MTTIANIWWVLLTSNWQILIYQIYWLLSNVNIIFSTSSTVSTLVIPIISQLYIIILYARNLPMLTTHHHHVFAAVMESKIINLTIKYVRSYLITHYLTMDKALIIQPTWAPCQWLYVSKQLITSLDSLSIVVNTELYVIYCHNLQGRTETKNWCHNDVYIRDLTIPSPAISDWY